MILSTLLIRKLRCSSSANKFSSNYFFIRKFSKKSSSTLNFGTNFNEDGIIRSEFPSVPIAKNSFSETILNAIWKHSLEQPNRPAIISAENEKDYVTYTQLYLYSHSVAAYLKDYGFGQGDIAAAVLPNCWQYITIFIGAAIQGGAISGTNQNFTESELVYQFIDSKAKILFCSDKILSKIVKAAEQCPNLKNIIVVPSTLDSTNNNNPESILPKNVIHFSKVLEYQPIFKRPKLDIQVDKEILLLPYSSGTTGKPKGVMLTHKSFGTMINILNYHKNYRIMLKLDSKWDWKTNYSFFVLPLYHIFGFANVINCLISGGCTILLKTFEPDLFCQIIQKFQITQISIVPPILVFLAKSPIVDNYDLSSLKFLLSGAAPAGYEIIQEVKQRLPTIQQISQGYGLTEISMASHLPIFGMNNPASVGRLVANMEMKVVDVETKKPLKFNEQGEICIRGPNIMLGYLNQPEATAQTIDKDGWLLTGDIGYQDEEGWTYVVDRLKELIKVKGYQVAPAELEDILLGMSKIRDVAVIGIPDPISGEVPKAFVVKSDQDLTAKEVMDFVKERTIYYKHLKGGVEFVDIIPKSPSGKILRRLLR